MDLTAMISEEFLSDFDEMLDWLFDKGLGRQHRFCVYRRNLERLSRLEANADPTTVYNKAVEAGKLNEILTTFVETYPFVQALKTLRKANIQVPAELLKRAISGPSDAAKETTTSNTGRNATFELLVAGGLARDGLFPTLSLTNPDIQFEFEGRSMLVECKRLLSPSRVINTISEAAKQLRRCCNQDDNKGRESRGFVAIDISPVV